MELQQIRNNTDVIIPEQNIVKVGRKPFIEANTLEVSLEHLKRDCTIPVFSKDNECTISHQEFIDIANDCIHNVFDNQQVNLPEVRVSHIVKGRVPTAIGKPVKSLQENEKTIYYERMMFSIEIPSVFDDINGNHLSLNVGGVRAYNHENLYSKKGLEKFKFFIGFKNLVCCNMCVNSDGYVGDIKAGSVEDLRSQIFEIIGNYQMQNHLQSIAMLSEYKLTERQFAQLVGRCRLYNYLPKKEKLEIQPFLLNDSQISQVAKNYYEDESFCRDSNGDITLWNFYNLLTSSNKNSYIDSFLERSVNSHDIVTTLAKSLKNKTSCFYLN